MIYFDQITAVIPTQRSIAQQQQPQPTHKTQPDPKMGRKGVLLCDPISDLFTRLRNGQAARRATILHPYSRFTAAVLASLHRHGYIAAFEVIPPASPRAPQYSTLQISLKYNLHGLPAIRRIRRVSKPSRRVYRGIHELPLASGGLGSWILSTPAGVLHCAEAREKRVGGEVLGEIL